MAKDSYNLKVGLEATITTMLKTQCEKLMMNGSSERGNIVLITSSLTSLMQSTDIQISAHPLCGLGWIPNKKQYHEKPQGSFGNLASDHKFAALRNAVHNNFYP